MTLQALPDLDVQLVDGEDVAQVSHVRHSLVLQTQLASHSTDHHCPHLDLLPLLGYPGLDDLYLMLEALHSALPSRHSTRVTITTTRGVSRLKRKPL